MNGNCHRVWSGVGSLSSLVPLVRVEFSGKLTGKLREKPLKFGAKRAGEKRTLNLAAFE